MSAKLKKVKKSAKIHSEVCLSENPGEFSTNPRAIDIMKPMTFRATPEDRKAWTIYAIRQGMSIQRLMIIALRQYIAANPV